VIEQVRDLCLSLPHATENVRFGDYLHWGDHVTFEIGGKMFAIVAPEAGREAKAIAWKASAEDYEALLERPGVIRVPALARAQWVALEHWEAMRWPEIADRLVASYEMVKARLPKHVQANPGSAALRELASKSKGPRRTP
jgi:predicted DNA-binding protein (MmcQ/YjbR family)